MHELGIADAILRAALDEAHKAKAAQILRVSIRVGVLSGVDAESLTFAFDAIRAGAIAANATLEIVPAPAIADCPHCGASFQAEDGFYAACPSCGVRGATLRTGRELELVSLELGFDADEERSTDATRSTKNE